MPSSAARPPKALLAAAFGVLVFLHAPVVLILLYTFTTDVTGLLLYVESTSTTASYYIDSFSIVQLAPPPVARIR